MPPATLHSAPADSAAVVHAATVASQEALRTAQNLKAAQVKLEYIARRERAVRELLDEHAALRAGIEELRVQHATLTANRDALAAEANRIAMENAELKQQLAAALKPKAR